MKIELTPDAAHWVRTEVELGHFETPEDAVRFAVRKAKNDALRKVLDDAVAEGGEYSDDEMRQRVRQHLDRLTTVRDQRSKTDA